MKEICLRCGHCCRDKKATEEGFWIVLDYYCKHFERRPDGLGFCKVYDTHENKVLEIRDGELMVCMTADWLARAGLLPEACPYAKKIPDYRTKVINW